jgi:hypothetical protein
MKAITIRQPWATLVALGAKRIETRSWSTQYRGPLAIHASKSFTPLDREHCHGRYVRRRLREAGIEDPDDLPLGKVVAVAELVDCVRMTREFIDRLKETRPGEYSFGFYRPGRWSWHLRKVRPVEPPARAHGRLSVWEWRSRRIAEL